MRRREFITFLGGLAAAWPITGRAQHTAKVARIGYLSTNLASSPHQHEAFRQGLRDLGYVVSIPCGPASTLSMNGAIKHLAVEWRC